MPPIQPQVIRHGSRRLEPGQMDQDHNPLLLEDVIAEKSSSLAEDKCLEVATAKKDEGDAGGSRVDAKKSNDPIHVATKLGRCAVELFADPTSREHSVGQIPSRSLPREWCLSSPRAGPGPGRPGSPPAPLEP